MTELVSQNTRWQHWQSLLRSRLELACAGVRQRLPGQIPSRRELKSLAPLRRGLLVGLSVLTGLAAVGPILAIVSLELAIANQSASGAGNRALAGWESRSGGTYENILQRPLFSRSRQLLTAAAPAAVVLSTSTRAMLDPSVALRGVFMNGERAKAFLTSSDNPVGVWIALNEQWSGWRLSEIKPNQIVLEADGERQTLQLTVLAK
jgi:hypothetical protein